MENFRFLHAADLHLDSPLRGLQDDPEAPASAIRDATRRALVNLVDLALAEQVAFVLLAGDLYDGDWRDWHTGHFLVGQIARLTRAGIRVIAISGNHDAASVLTKQLPWPEGATLLGARRPETVDLPEYGVAVHGQSFTAREVTENLARGYPPRVEGRINIGLLHTAAGRGGHENYAPCTPEQLAGHGYEYWALGHVHAHEIIARDPWVVFPGNLQGRHVNEDGPKGAVLVEVAGRAIVDVRQVVLDTVRWRRLGVDASGAADIDAVLSRVRAALSAAAAEAGERLLAVRVILSGVSPAYAALARDPGGLRETLRATARGVSEQIWLEDVRLEVRPPAMPVAGGDAVGRLVQAIEAAGQDAVGPALRDYAEKMLGRGAGLRAALGEAHPAVRAARGEMSEALLQRARDLLLARLAGG